MKQEFNLSKKIVLKILEDLKESPKYEELMYLRVEDVKKFIKEILDEIENLKIIKIVNEDVEALAFAGGLEVPVFINKEKVEQIIKQKAGDKLVE